MVLSITQIIAGLGLEPKKQTMRALLVMACLVTGEVTFLYLGMSVRLRLIQSHIQIVTSLT